MTIQTGQIWLYAPTGHPGRGEMTVRVDCISALYEIRDEHLPLGVGRPWRIEAAVVGLPNPMVLATAPDRMPAGIEEPAFLGALPELRDELVAEQWREWPGLEISVGRVREFDPHDPHGRLPIDWERFPDPMDRA